MAYKIPAYRNSPRILLFTCVIFLAGCSTQSLLKTPLAESPKVSHDTDSARQLKNLPPARQNTVVSVYEFQDQTGQLKTNDNFADYSRAVTQGGVALLNKALLQAGNGRWFDVVERSGLKNLLQERQIIQLTRAQYTSPKNTKTPALPPLLYAGMLIEGGVVGYDSNIATGGAGANYLGVGGDVKYRRDIVTVDLRAVSVVNGQVLISVTAEKTIYSTAVDASVFKYVSFDHLLQMETGFTLNEPPQLAVRQAIETAVYSLIMEGARKNYWQFADENAGRNALNEYVKTVEDGNPVVTATASDAPSPSNIVQQPAQSQPVTQPSIKEIKSGKNAILKEGIAETPAPSSEEDKIVTLPENSNGIPLNPADYPITPQPGKK